MFVVPVKTLSAFLRGTFEDRAESLIEALGKVKVPLTDKSVIEVDFKRFCPVPVCDMIEVDDWI